MRYYIIGALLAGLLLTPGKAFAEHCFKTKDGQTRCTLPSQKAQTKKAAKQIYWGPNPKEARPLKHGEKIYAAPNCHKFKTVYSYRKKGCCK